MEKKGKLKHFFTFFASLAQRRIFSVFSKILYLEFENTLILSKKKMDLTVVLLRQGNTFHFYCLRWKQIAKERKNINWSLRTNTAITKLIERDWFVSMINHPNTMLACGSDLYFVEMAKDTLWRRQWEHCGKEVWKRRDKSHLCLTYTVEPTLKKRWLQI